MKLSIIIPAYNEEKTVGEILTKVQKVDLGDIKKEIIIVDDGSTDRTTKIAELLSKKDSSIHLIKHNKNMGKGAAVQAGIKNSKGDIILIQDADLEYDPSDIPELIKPILENKFQVVYGTRLKVKPVFTGKNKTPFLTHFFGNKLLSMITSFLYSSNISDMETGYKAFDKHILKGIKLQACSFDFEPEITAKILKKGIKIHEINIKTKPRGYEEGKKINTVKDGLKALWTLIKYRIIN
ncbi:MAG: glycosyl transferase [Candidatus Levybacteria bacterium RIFCSPHIGHO2_01_FULL_36_15]|nr:MAG: glycosyl transferase [Candidatus Levybacteria bacterium RIFCSPHIGHO2_01_FULL_36_15]OGH38461.1 MAG: glycosyl transferase [Candidatus Levybacteria bacterium RIFCSPLOWO2_01_FULL_36_10]